MNLRRNKGLENEFNLRHVLEEFFSLCLSSFFFFFFPVSITRMLCSLLGYFHLFYDIFLLKNITNQYNFVIVNKGTALKSE